VPIVSNNQPNYFTLSDFNNDDKPDLVTSDFVCFTNNSQPGVLSFSSQTRISYNGSLYHFEAGCFDGDDKNDLVTSDQLYMITFRNTGTGNTIDSRSPTKYGARSPIKQSVIWQLPILTMMENRIWLWRMV